ncbi:MAG: hypothetical protein ABSB86_03090 [Bryobacteraceae bacterium]|jgi:hypothetical protein
MRRLLLVLVLVSLPLAAQRGGHGGGGGMRGGGGISRGGGGISRGGGSLAIRSGGNFGGYRGGFTRQNAFRGNFGSTGFRRVGFYPYFYPGVYGGFGWYDSYPYDSYDSSYPYGYGYSDPGYAAGGPPAMIVQDLSGYPASPPPPPPAPVVRLAPGPQLPGPQHYEAPLYLVAFQDGVIRAVAAYWAEGSVLHYVSMDHEQKQAPLASVDRLLSERLNRERNVTFSLPR